MIGNIGCLFQRSTIFQISGNTRRPKGVIAHGRADTCRDRTTLDLKAEYSINRTYSAYLDIYNLTDEWNFQRVVKAFGLESPWSAQHTGMAFVAGIKARF